jgi:hypothetical protein
VRVVVSRIWVAGSVFVPSLTHLCDGRWLYSEGVYPSEFSPLLSTNYTALFSGRDGHVH